MAPPRSELPGDYAEVLGEIKQRIQTDRLRVVLAANAALVQLYWDIGRLILERQERAGWGAKIIDRLAADLSEAYPDMKGFSPRNLKYMRAFAAAWPDRGFVQAALAQITWYHNIALLERLGDPQTRLWYAERAAREGWSRSILQVQIERRLHERQGHALHNFQATLPPLDSDMAAQVFKDPYVFDFLGTADPRREREVELRCFVVVELKAVPFEPAFVGQMNLYLSPADELADGRGDRGRADRGRHEVAMSQNKASLQPSHQTSGAYPPNEPQGNRAAAPGRLRFRCRGEAHSGYSFWTAFLASSTRSHIRR